MNGLKSSTTTQIGYVAFFVLWTLPIACLALASPGLVSRLIRQAGLAGIRPDEASHQLATLAAFWLITAAMFTYMLINLAVIQQTPELLSFLNTNISTINESETVVNTKLMKNFFNKVGAFG